MHAAHGELVAGTLCFGYFVFGVYVSVGWTLSPHFSTTGDRERELMIV